MKSLQIGAFFIGIGIYWRHRVPTQKCQGSYAMSTLTARRPPFIFFC